MSEKVCSITECGKQRQRGTILCEAHETKYMGYARRRLAAQSSTLHRSGWAKRRPLSDGEAKR